MQDWKAVHVAHKDRMQRLQALQDVMDVLELEGCPLPTEWGAGHLRWTTNDIAAHISMGVLPGTPYGPSFEIIAAGGCRMRAIRVQASEMRTTATIFVTELKRAARGFFG